MVEAQPLSPCNGRQSEHLSPVTQAREILAYMFPELGALGFMLSPATQAPARAGFKPGLRVV